MKAIVREFYRAHRFVPLRYFTVCAICVAAFFLTGAFERGSTRISAVIVSAFLAAAALWSLIDVLIAPRLFAKRLGKLPESGRSEVLSNFSNTVSIGKRWFFENYLLYFAKRRIVVLRYDELQSSDLKGSRLFLRLADGRKLPLPFEPNENPAVLVAALRSKNGQLAATIDGKPVDFVKKNKRKEDA
ncbi:MAG: hypothetical protein K2J80_12215 [Oscillospiraceae bacterium]|nr:hypothetical protein [Oscillospiraceae bacterium]